MSYEKLFHFRLYFCNKHFAALSRVCLTCLLLLSISSWFCLIKVCNFILFQLHRCIEYLRICDIISYGIHLIIVALNANYLIVFWHKDDWWDMRISQPLFNIPGAWNGLIHWLYYHSLTSHCLRMPSNGCQQLISDLLTNESTNATMWYPSGTIPQSIMAIEQTNHYSSIIAQRDVNS